MQKDVTQDLDADSSDDNPNAGGRQAGAGNRWVERIPFLARLKGMANGLNPRYGFKTVVVSRRTGDVLRVERRGKEGGEG